VPWRPFGWSRRATGVRHARWARGGSPTISPAGNSLVFVRADQLWSASLTGKSKATQLTHLRGKLASPRFSPDGTRMVFVADRDTHRFVGVLELGAKQVTWLDPGVDTDGYPAWSPDGREIAFIRTPADASPPSFVPRRSATTPWSIRIADVSTGAGREVFRADAGDGSVFHALDTNAEDLWWTADGRIAFPWEQSGWMHLYSVPSTGGTSTELTPGEYEIEHVALAPDRNTFVLTSNELALDGRTLWRIPPGGAPRERLDDGEALFEFFPAPLEDAVVAYLETAARQPVTLVVRDARGARTPVRGGALADRFPASALIEPSNVTFPSADGLAVHGQLFMPGTAAGARVPAAIFDCMAVPCGRCSRHPTSGAITRARIWSLSCSRRAVSPSSP
jgi:dipeptidyl aminopeptidase/acylaminoacyl peptidase